MILKPYISEVIRSSRSGFQEDEKKKKKNSNIKEKIKTTNKETKARSIHKLNKVEKKKHRAQDFRSFFLLFESGLGVANPFMSNGIVHQY